MGLDAPAQEPSCAKCGASLPAHFISSICPACALSATMGGLLGTMGPYSLEEVLGRGGMGVVYIGLHQKTGRAVAVKVPILTDENATELRRRFATEAEVLTSFDHPGILPLYEVGEDGGVPYYAMKLAEGNLAEHLTELTADPKRMALYMAAVAEAVHYAHQRGVLHRDLKPQNILLDDCRHPLVADFGLARLVGRETNITLGEGMLGTPDYVAPEVAAGGPRAATVASDIFSLGAILYHGLTGSAPFHGDSIIETLSRIARGEIDPARMRKSRVPEDLELICLKCLEVEPSARYVSAATLAADLRAWLEGRPLLVRPPTWSERSWQLIRRNPIVSALSLITIAVSVSGTTAIWVSHERALVAERNRADAAVRLADERLVAQCKVEADSLIRSGRAGQRDRALRLLQQAWAVRPDPDIRSLAIQALSLADLEEAAKPSQGILGGRVGGPVPDAVSVQSGYRAYLDPESDRGFRVDDAMGKNVFSARLMHSVRAFAWNPAGDRLVIATSDKHLYLWNTGDQGVERRMSSRESATYAMAWHPTRDLVACQTEDGRVRLWDIASGDDWVNGYYAYPDVPVQWSLDGRSLVGRDGGVSISIPEILRIYRPEFFEPRMEDLGTVSLSDDGQYAAVVSESGARIWNLVSGRPIALFDKAMDEWLGARWLPDGLLLGGWNSPLRLVPFEVLTGSLSPSIGQPLPADDGCTLAELSANNEWAALLHTHLHRFLLRSMKTGQLVSLAQSDPYWIALSGNGAVVATSSFRGSTIKIWSLPDGRMVREIPFRFSTRLALLADGTALLATAGLQVFEFNPQTGDTNRTIDSDEEVRQATYSPDGRWIAIATSRSVQLHQHETGVLLAKLTIPSSRPGEHQVSMAFSKRGNLLAVQLANSSLAVWNLPEIERQLTALGMGW